MGVIYGSVENMSGSVYGYGFWFGSGFGYGDGFGDGSGSGDGSMDGDGSGYGSSKEYLQAVADGVVGERAPQLRANGAVLAFWRSGKDGKPMNGGSGPERTVGMIEEESGDRPCHRGMLHATMTPEAWKGERLWVVALYPPVIEVDENKFASKKREILAEIVPNFYE